MSYSWSRSGGENRPPLSVLVMIASLSASFSWFLTIMFNWKLVGHPYFCLLAPILLAAASTLFTAAIYGEYLSRPLLAGFLLISQMGSFLVWLHIHHLPLRSLTHPDQLLGIYSGWLIASLAAGFMPVPWVERLCRLSRSPDQNMLGMKSEPINAMDEAFQETWGRMLMPAPEDNGLERGATFFWQSEWEKWRQTLIWLILAVLGIAALSQRGIQSGIQLMVGQCLLFGVVSIALMMLISGFYLYKRAVWISEKMDVSGVAFHPWIRWFGRAAMILVIISLLLPAGFAFSFHHDQLTFTREATQQVIRAKAGTVQPSDELIGKFLSGLFGGSFMSLMGFMFLAVLLVPVLIVVLSVLNADFRKFRAIPKILAKLLQIFMELWKGAAQWGGQLVRSKILGRPVESESPDGVVKRSVHSWGKGPKAVIRRGYYHLIEEARAQGMPFHPFETPGEISERLKEMLPEDGQALETVTETYREARYGPKLPGTETIGFFERIRRTLQHKLKRSEP